MKSWLRQTHVNERLVRVYDLSLQAAWILLILLLPLTSLPWMARLARSEMVASPAGLPLLWLAVFLLVPYSLRRGGFPALVKPLLAFAAVAALTSIFAWFRDVPVFKDRSLLSRELQAYFTLLVGLGFYLVTTAWLKSTDRLRMTLRLLNIAGLVIILWSFMQAAVWAVLGEVPNWLNDLQTGLTMRPFFPERVNGLTLEPSWLAHQLNMLFLPYWLAATVKRYSAWRYKLLGVSVENALLAGGAATLFLSFSRVGLLAFLLVLAFLFLRANIHLARHIYQRIAMRRKDSHKRLMKSLVYSGMAVIFIVVYLAGAAGVVVGASRFDERLAHLFEKPEDSIFSLEYANQLAFAERMIYWATGWEIFNDHPATGVGIGVAGYYFPEEMPSFGWYLPEIRDLLYRAAYLPNTKSLWSRLLAETGVIGFAFFVVWLYLIWQGASFLRKRESRLDQAVGLMGAFVVVAMLVEGFSVDTFALPYWWISLGMVTAATGRQLIKEQKSVKSSLLEGSRE